MPPFRRKDERKRVSFDEDSGGAAIDVFSLDEALYGKISETTGPLIQIVDGNLSAHGFTLTSTGLQVSATVNQAAWEDLGTLLFKLEGAIQWLIGDWLLYGVELAWGDIPKIAEALDMEAARLHRYKQMASEFEYARRRVELSFGHHECVRALSADQQDEALAYAAQQDLSVAAFRKWLRGNATQERQTTETTVTTPQWTIEELERWDMGRATAHEKAATLAYVRQQRQRWEALEKKLE